MGVSTHAGGAGSTWSGVHIEELAIEIGCYLEALPRGAYRRQLHNIFAELLEFHRENLDDSVIPLVGDTLAAIDPDASPSPATLAELDAPMAGCPGRFACADLQRGVVLQSARRHSRRLGVGAAMDGPELGLRDCGRRHSAARNRQELWTGCPT
jgi:hypothetical protein